MKNYPKVGVGAVILDHHRILLTKRRKAPEKDHWSLLGGKVEWMETCEDAIRREIYEEAGIHIEIDSLLCVTNHCLPNESMHFVSPTYCVTQWHGEPYNKEPLKHYVVAWFDLDDLPEPLTITTRNALLYLKK